jgi:hypothetical protein
MIYTKGDEAFLKPEPTPSHRKRNKKIFPVGVKQQVLHTNHMEGDQLGQDHYWRQRR